MTVNVQVGKRYQRTDGGREYISHAVSNSQYPYISNTGTSYTAYGLAAENNIQANLIREWPTEPQQPTETMTLRDQFAMAILSGNMSHSLITARFPKDYAIAAYEYADAMMKARGNTNDTGKSDDV